MRTWVQALVAISLIGFASAGWGFVWPQTACRIKCLNGGVCTFNYDDSSQHRCECLIGVWEGDRCQWKVGEPHTDDYLEEERRAEEATKTEEQPKIPEDDGSAHTEWLKEQETAAQEKKRMEEERRVKAEEERRQQIEKEREAHRRQWEMDREKAEAARAEETRRRDEERRKQEEERERRRLEWEEKAEDRRKAAEERDRQEIERRRKQEERLENQRREEEARRVREEEERQRAERRRQEDELNANRRPELTSQEERNMDEQDSKTTSAPTEPVWEEYHEDGEADRGDAGLGKHTYDDTHLEEYEQASKEEGDYRQEETEDEKMKRIEDEERRREEERRVASEEARDHQDYQDQLANQEKDRSFNEDEEPRRMSDDEAEVEKLTEESNALDDPQQHDMEADQWMMTKRDSESAANYRNIQFTVILLGRSMTMAIWFETLLAVAFIAYAQQIEGKMMEECREEMRTKGISPSPPLDGGTWCNATWDTVLCWPPTRANASAIQQCPDLKGLDPTKFVTKRCDPAGKWTGRNETEIIANEYGYTNFTMCFATEVMQIIDNLATITNKNPQD
ncbi:unnamed protein product, partial [Mesorhabditis spiculigera]